MVLFLFYIPFKGKERSAKTKLMPAKLSAVLACAESLKFEYLCENDFLRETILTCLSGAQMGWIN